MKAGKHVVTGRDYLALSVPLVLSAIMAYSMLGRNSASWVSTAIIFVLFFIPAVFIWWRRMKKNPENPWKYKI